MNTAEAYQPRINPDLVERMFNNPVGIAIVYKTLPIGEMDMEAYSKANKENMEQRAQVLEARGIIPETVTDFGMIFLDYQGNLDRLLDGEEVFSIIERKKYF